MNNICLFTYTHSNCRDLWPIYFDLLDKNASGLKSVVASNVVSDQFTNHKFVEYQDKHYCNEIADIVEKNIDTEYMIYMQEDFFLYAPVDMQKMEYVRNFLNDTDVSYARLIKCGVVTEQEVDPNIYWIQLPEYDHFSVTAHSLQPTLWKTEDFIQLYKNTNYDKFQEGMEFTHTMNRLDMLGVYYYSGEQKRGMMHWDSSVFPYIATAIVKGKWNMSEYPNELKPILKQYGIDPNIRGIFQ